MIRFTYDPRHCWQTKQGIKKDATSSETDSNENFNNSENSWDFNFEKLTKSTHSSMMAALGQPSSAPPSCGAPPPTVDPR